MKAIWLKNPEAHDYPAAFDYLELLFPSKTAALCVTKLNKSKTVQKKQKTI
jgi:hypothetical protein